MAHTDGDGERVETMGRRLASLRVLNGWTQDDVAERVGSSQVQLSRLEMDLSMRPPIELLARLATLYGVTIDYLWNGTKERTAMTARA